MVTVARCAPDGPLTATIAPVPAADRPSGSTSASPPSSGARPGAALARALAPLALMALIFFLSAQPDLGTDLGVIDLIGRKIGHAGAYATLTVLWWWALAPVAGRRRRLIAAAAIALLYGISDEYHQTFTDGRVGSPLDVAIDAAGVAVAVWLLTRPRLAARLARHPSRSRSASAE